MGLMVPFRQSGLSNFHSKIQTWTLSDACSTCIHKGFSCQKAEEVKNHFKFPIKVLRFGHCSAAHRGE